MLLPCPLQNYLYSHCAAANGVRDTSATIMRIMENLGRDKVTALQQLQLVKVARYLTNVL